MIGGSNVIIAASGLRSSIGEKLKLFFAGLGCSFLLDDSKLKSKMDVTIIIARDTLSLVNS